MKFMKVEEWRMRKLFRFVKLCLTGGSLMLGLVLLIVGSVMISGYNVFLDFITGSYKESAVGILVNFITGSYKESAVWILVMGVIVICTSSLGFYAAAALESLFDTMDLFYISFMFSVMNFNFLTGSYKESESAVGILVTGVIVTYISSLGFYAALKSLYDHFDKNYLFLVLVIVIAVICAPLASVTIQLTKERSQDLGMLKKLRKSIDMYGSDSFKDQTDGWDRIQTELECCGLAGEEDYANSTFLSQTGQLPRSCCGPLQIVDLFGQIEPCRGETASRYQTGCVQALKSYLSNKDVVFGVIAVVEAIMQVSIVVGATVLVRMIKWAIVLKIWKKPYVIPNLIRYCLPMLRRLYQPADHIV